jgi:hypothetical protein
MDQNWFLTIYAWSLSVKFWQQAMESDNILDQHKLRNSQTF